ncbi:DNA-formamidopyrimidine glycosylase family protein [Mucilaginibacter glaciei]|uniref:Formamidopyrimidine-DNA glycosylase n=1 Tax=Mucilaginibacter glaciei TaxID=2772109 RepID=A0A926NQK2_9SPHI|nr:DNA-formamidopyrimidine glycosylase family protein [Mucilaginibacter glaciei]MBD1395511.1 formamidopyrimidine-DNA glycosylase [Mucilaginibacter glaciei]
MAELPDLTVFAQILTRKYKGEELDKVEVTVEKKLNVPVADLKSALKGQKLLNVIREGKTLQLHFSSDQIVGLHLMLRGELVELNNGKTPRFQVLAFHFKNGSGFSLIDLQKQATPTLQPKPAVAPDALNIDKSVFSALLAKKRTLIKTLLMDQKVIRGIGNSYSDEILYHAGVSPFSIPKAIPSKDVAKIYNSIRTVLEKAIHDIAGANGDKLTGELKDFMNIHSPQLKTTAKGEIIKTAKIGGRTTYYTDAQELFV